MALMVAHKLRTAFFNGLPSCWEAGIERPEGLPGSEASLSFGLAFVFVLRGDPRLLVPCRLRFPVALDV